MTAHHRTKGFVFKKQDHGDADRIFSVFTSDFGKLEIRGKAIRKINSKLRAGINTFSLSEIEFIQGKNYKTLTDAILLARPKMTLAKMEFFKKISGFLDSFIGGQEKDEKIFCLINETLSKLEELQNLNSKIQILYLYFFWNFFSELGYAPEIQKCVKCGGKLVPYQLYFSSREGGVMCKRCLGTSVGAKKINSDTVKILRLIFKKDWQILSKLKIESSSRGLLKQISSDYHLYMLSLN